MRRSLALACIFCLATTTGLAQNRLNGRWATDRPTDPLTTDAQRKQSVQLEVTVQDDKASGTLNLGGLGGTFYTFKDGKATDNKVLFRTDPRTETTWTIEMVDNNTVMLYHGPLELVGSNVLDLIPGFVERSQFTFPVQAASTLTQGGANTSIRGIVQDQSKALIPGVTVTATNVETGAKITTLTDETGRYGFPDLTPGKYTLAASVPAFRTATVSNLSIGDTQLL